MSDEMFGENYDAIPHGSQGNAEGISTPPLSCKPHDECKRYSVEQGVAMGFENWACKCLGKNIGNLFACRNFKHAQNFLLVKFADEMLL